MVPFFFSFQGFAAAIRLLMKTVLKKSGGPAGILPAAVSQLIDGPHQK